MIIRAVLFDLDGTLVDSLGDLTDAVNHIRSAFSHPPLTAAAVRLKIGKGARNLVQQTLPGAMGADIEQALDMFLEFNRLHIADKSRLYPGITETLRELAARNIKLAVISNKNEDLSTLILEHLGVRPLFESISGGDTFPERKPSPLPLLKVAAELRLPPYECVMVGDSCNDIQAAKRANITSIACTWGYGNAEELDGADIFARSPQELLALIIEGF
ncbi:MAG: HAD-IA family hydrolase [Desulfuromonadaceae bacterium]|nr:HAD-IA family hydrolase [Desulfuromonadaceae bacterium]MDD2849215.1 HAD-IA family hydrolase [Desulfuromonadaceae bacterium]MDD4129736.1 HAD-IA family hydrolase [Desulfuromonadaceae bacterium]